MTQSGSENPIGVFDSGVGGLTILRAVRHALPRENLVYVADAAYVPYGQKSPEQIRDRAMAIGGFLVQQRAKAIVVACNTATAAAIDMLRARLPIPFVGVEPAVKPAVAATRSGVVGVLATPATLASERYRSLIERFAGGVRIVAQPCAGLAEHIERGDLDGERTDQLLRSFVERANAADRAAADRTMGAACPHAAPAGGSEQCRTRLQRNLLNILISRSTAMTINPLR